ncbi:hypothetical protein PACID_24570 [Acidipropionibacterium acidipropionici ATCC 4875]|uniref:Uncharacterized protein n=1 Tax=Acidipropionibacterium acidipropionici (strain ATCC 4875 / DSM 20272 / JCM 6432 / NBRC 12425 / NCIMB 8070 / 4) TaxID=1171373 RepID=K7RYY7_ACIA4|nr:hypothetical protein PACID_24570 [Acidipropionibacterium acidipropionici ATCC 4875]
MCTGLPVAESRTIVTGSTDRLAAVPNVALSGAGPGFGIPAPLGATLGTGRRGDGSGGGNRRAGMTGPGGGETGLEEGTVAQA